MRTHVMFPMVVGVLLTACGGSVENTPSGVVRAALMAASAEDYPAAKSLMASETRFFGKVFKPKEQATASYWREFTLGRKIAKVDVKGEEINGSDAMVVATLTYADQRTMQVTMAVTAENGRWRLTGMYEKRRNW